MPPQLAPSKWRWTPVVASKPAMRGLVFAGTAPLPHSSARCIYLLTHSTAHTPLAPQALLKNTHCESRLRLVALQRAVLRHADAQPPAPQGAPPSQGRKLSARCDARPCRPQRLHASPSTAAPSSRSAAPARAPRARARPPACPSMRCCTAPRGGRCGRAQTTALKWVG